MKKIVHAACPHDCPDACGVLITVEDGRATRIQGDPDHPVTRGFLCELTRTLFCRRQPSSNTPTCRPPTVITICNFPSRRLRRLVKRVRTPTCSARWLSAWLLMKSVSAPAIGEMIAEALTSDDPWLQDVTPESLAREHHQRLHFVKNPEVPFLPFSEGGFATSSGKAEHYSEALAARP